MKFERISLSYAYDALEPYIDAATMKVHYEAHHKTYETKFLEKFNQSDIKNKYSNLYDFFRNINKIENETDKQYFINFAGGLLNHNIYFEQFIIGKEIKNEFNVSKAIVNSFGSIEEFKSQFKQAALSLFGSGWVWIVNNNGKIEIIKTINQDNPLRDGKWPILGIDLWEHAYYLKHQSARGNHFEDFWMVINWEYVESRFNNVK